MIGWLDIPTAASWICTSKRTIETWIRKEGLRVSRVRGKRLIKKEWLDEFLEQHEVSSKNELECIVDEVVGEFQN